MAIPIKRKRKLGPETQLKRACKQFLELHQIQTWPIVAGMGSPPGLPDRFGVSPGGFALALEFKAGKSDLTDAQREFKSKWERAGGIYIVVRRVEDIAKKLGIKTLIW